MAHKMVRQPSETPNINNIDDIVPFRYAYGNQDGYVINKGNELSYTINGNQFRINSGRVVLQGVEDDIDANGITFTIDNIASKRYYVIYYRVNLATNTTSYEITYDTAGYPTIDVGDDLTKNSSGIANLPIYRFMASSGVISGVEKVVKFIEYINKDTTIKNAENAENSKNINGLEIKKDENGVLRIGHIIIPQQYLLWSGNASINGSDTNITLPIACNDGDLLEVEYTIKNIYTNKTYNAISQFRVTNNMDCAIKGSGITSRIGSNFYADVAPVINITNNSAIIKGDMLYIEGGNIVSWSGENELSSVCVVTKLYKVIR